MKGAPDKHERLARAYDSEVWPLTGQRLAQMVVRAVEPRPGTKVLELGAATGAATEELLRRLPADAHVTAVDHAALVALAQRRLGANPALAGRFAVAPGALPLPFPDGRFDVAVSHAAFSEAADAQPPADVIGELARVLRPGGQLVAGLALRGTWAELLDIYRDVLEAHDKPDSLAALSAYVASFPDGEAAARRAEEAGLREVEVAVQRWELLFKSAREFFFAPAIELGPLSRWKQMAGRGEEMQDVFFFVKEAIDAYFGGGAFAVTVVAGCVKGVKPGP